MTLLKKILTIIMAVAVVLIILQFLFPQYFFNVSDYGELWKIYGLF